MRRWMTIITLSALIFAVAAGWGIGQLAGGGSGDPETVVRAMPTLAPTTTAEPTPVPTIPPEATPASAPEAPAQPTDAPAIQQPTSIPDSP